MVTNDLHTVKSKEYFLLFIVFAISETFFLNFIFISGTHSPGFLPSPLVYTYWSSLFVGLLICPVLKHSVVPDCDAIECSPPGSSVHGILQARILEWVAMPSSRGSSQPKDQTQVSSIAGGFFTIWATREAQEYWSG